MKNLKLLNNLIFQILLIIIYLFPVLAIEPVDIWKSNSEITSETLDLEEEKANEENVKQSLFKKSKIENNIIFEEGEKNLNFDQVFGLFDPAENDLSLRIWIESDGKIILEHLKRIEKINLSKDSEELLTKILFTNAYDPVKNINPKVFLNYKIEWLIKNEKINIIEKFLEKNPNLENKTNLLKYLVEEYLSRANINGACEKMKFINREISNDYIDKFRIYCLITEKKIDEAQLQYDLLKERGFKDSFYNNKINYLMGYTEKIDTKISDKDLFNFHLSHIVNKNFQYDPSIETSKYIWRYLSSANLLSDSETIDLEDENKINLYEKAAAKNSYSKKELFDIYKKFLFSINQFLHVEESYKLLPPHKARALVYQSALLADNLNKKFGLLILLNDLFKKDGIEEVFSEELFLILSKIDKDEVPENHIGFYRYKINKTTEDIKKIKFNNKILHRSKLLKYFINENYKIEKIENDLVNIYKKIKKNKDYYFSAKDVILLDSLKADGVKLPKKLDNQYSNDQLTIPQGLIDLSNQGEIGLVLLKIIEIVGEDELENLDPETLYFIVATLNKLDLKKIRNEIIVKTLPDKV